MYKIVCPHCHKNVNLLHSRKVWLTGVVAELDPEPNGYVETFNEEEFGDVLDSQFECGHCARPFTDDYARANATK